MILKNKTFDNSLAFFFISILPISIIIGPAISLLNILCISFLFIIIYFKSKDINFQKKELILFFLIFYIYLILNFFLGIDFENSSTRSFGFLRFILLFLAINYFFLKIENFNKIFKIWAIILSLLAIDGLYEVIFKANIFGWGDFSDSANQGQRIVSFFKDEPVVGSFLFCFILLLSGYMLENKELKNKKIFFTLFFSFLFLIILLSGERSNFLKTIFASVIFIFISREFSKAYIVKLFLFLTIALVIIFNSYSYLFNKYSYLVNSLSFSETNTLIKKNIYFDLYKSGYAVFLDNKLFGVGQKNYGKYASIKDAELKNENNTTINFLIISTHPHQIYIEFLSEHGILGTIILLGLFFYIFYKMIRIIISSRNNIQIGCFCYLVSGFLPILPTGSFFSDFNATLFWINFSIFFAVSKETNIFKLK